jgi:FixJ family two-component response regulator
MGIDMTQPSRMESTVFIVDDDHSIRNAMEMLMRSVGHGFRIFPSAAEFLEEISPKAAGCLVLDIRMPGLGGLELHKKLIERGSTLPIIFVTGYGDVSMAVEVMRNGAFDFIEKPFRDQELLDRINDALLADNARRSQLHESQLVFERIKRLTNREREVMQLVVTGTPNKIIAHELDVSQRTVEIHRARVMEKMEARSLVDLVRMTLATQI